MQLREILTAASLRLSMPRGWTGLSTRHEIAIGTLPAPTLARRVYLLLEVFRETCDRASGFPGQSFLEKHTKTSQVPHVGLCRSSLRLLDLPSQPPSAR